MSVDGKEIKISIRGVLELLATSSRSFVRKYPVVSGILLLFFILYMFFPSVFTFLVFSVPVLLFMVVALRLVFRFHQQNLEKAKGAKRNFVSFARKPTSVQYDLVEHNTEDSPALHQLVRRRNAKEEDKRVSLSEGVEGKDAGFSEISNDDLVDKAALIEENPKDIREVNVDSVIDCTENSSAASQRSRHECGGAFEGMTNKFDYGASELNSESSDDGEDEDEEEKVQEDGNKAVEWTEDDQKNLMDLGISEMERNKRLESLIARRKARKLLSMQVRRTPMNTRNTNPCGQIASVLVTKPDPFFSNVASEPQVSRTPGSAPSVLLPMHNPFDLPYDPQEEKPNLTGGSFEDEFMTASQKDLMFCRHESFSLGPSFPGPREFDQNRRGTFYFQNFPTRPRAPEIPEYSRFRNQSGNENPSPKPIQTESSVELKPMPHINSSHADVIQQGQASELVCNLADIHDEEDRIEVQKESNLVGDDITGGSSSSSSSDVNVPFSAAKKEEILKSLSFLAPKNIAVGFEYNGRRNDPLCDGSPASFRNKTPEERFFFPDKVISHTPTHSIASDMQVEVSEVSSPELTVDGTISPFDGISLSYDVDLDVGKEANSGSEEMWVASSQLSKVEELESRSSEVHEVSEQDIIDVGFSRMNKTTKDIIASNMLPEKVVKEDSIDAILSFPNVELPETSRTHLIGFDGKVHDNVRLPSTYASDALSTENSASLTYENTLQSSKKSAAHPSLENNSGEPEEQSDSQEISAREVNISCDTNGVVFANDDSEILEFIKNTYGEAPVLLKGDAAGEPYASNMENDGQCFEITEVDSEVQEHDISNPFQIFEGEFKQQSALISNLNGNENENIQDRRGEPIVIDVGSPGFDPSCNESTASATQPEIVAEQGPSVSHSSSSSTSMTQEKFLTSEVYLPNFDQTPQIKFQQIASEVVVDDNFVDRSMPESSDLIVFQNALHFKEGSVTCLPHDRYLEKPLLGKLAEHKDMASPSRIIEKIDLWESTVDRGCDQSAPDIIHSGISQISIDPTPLDMQLELVIEQVPIASSSSSSPKSGVQKNVSVEEVSSASIHTETYIKVQKSDEETVEINLLDKLLPENLENSNPVDNCSTLETVQERGQEIVEVEMPEVSPSTELVPVMMIGTAGNGLSQINQSFIRDSNPQNMLPEVVVEQVPMVSSSSSSPNSVLQSKFSTDQGSVLSLESLDQEIRVEAQQSETEENALINGLQSENLIADGHQRSLYSTKDSMDHLSDGRYSGDLQEPSNSPGKFPKEREEPSMDDPGKRFFEEQADTFAVCLTKSDHSNSSSDHSKGETKDLSTDNV